MAMDRRLLLRLLSAGKNSRPLADGMRYHRRFHFQPCRSKFLDLCLEQKFPATLKKPSNSAPWQWLGTPGRKSPGSYGQTSAFQALLFSKAVADRKAAALAYPAGKRRISLPRSCCCTCRISSLSRLASPGKASGHLQQ